MEENITNGARKTVITHTMNPSDTGKGLSGNIHIRVTELTKALRDAHDEISKTCDRNSLQILASLSFCAIMIVIGIIYSYKLLDPKNIPSTEPIIIIYLTITRAIIVAGVFYVATYSFKILKSYLHIHQRNTHRLMVIKSMASLVATSSEVESTRNLIHKGLLEIIVNFDKNGILKDEEKGEGKDENKDVHTLLVELTKEVVNKIPSPIK